MPDSQPLMLVDRTIDGALVRNCALRTLRIQDVDLSGATFSNVNLSGAQLHDVNLSGMVITDADIAGLTILGHDIAALIRAEIARTRR